MTKTRELLQKGSVSPKPIYERVELANLLNVTVRTIDRMEAKKIITGYRIEGLGKKKYFKYSDVYKAIFGEEVEERKQKRA